MKKFEPDPFVRTASGGKLSFLTPHPDQISIQDIAHQLAHTCRWAGSTKHFFSVAQHSLMVAKLVSQQGASKVFILQALLHDAAEAYMGDLARPIKHSLPLKGYATVERNLLNVILEKYTQRSFLAEVVKEKDNLVQHTEAKFLLNYEPDWLVPGYIDFGLGQEFCQPNAMPANVKAKFLDKFLSLV